MNTNKINLIHLFIFHPDDSFPSLFSPSPMHHLKKWQATHGYPQNVACHIVERLSISPFKFGQGNPE